jgi:V8-like Glu-specific endopeptidase
MKKFLNLFGFLSALSFLGPASAVTDGELDGDNHPAVVLILMEVGGQPAFRCSGTLIAPTFVLTAGHCAGAPGEFSGMRIYTESDVENGDNLYPYAGPNSIEATAFAAHPEYPNASFVFHDVGMIKLASPVNLDLGQYGTLPIVNSNDDLRRGRKTGFRSVGYGLQRINPVFVEAERVRMVANPWLIQINVPGFVGDFSLLLSNNAATGGTCFGDSGGPNFLGDSMVVAGVTSFGINGNCAGTGGVFRIDRLDVIDFINGFMAFNP